MSLTAAEHNLRQTIIDRRCTRDDVAVGYADAIGVMGFVNWPEIDQAIMERWSRSGLEYIKRAAWNRRAGEEKS